MSADVSAIDSACLLRAASLAVVGLVVGCAASPTPGGSASPEMFPGHTVGRPAAIDALAANQQDSAIDPAADLTADSTPSPADLLADQIKNYASSIPQQPARGQSLSEPQPLTTGQRTPAAAALDNDDASTVAILNYEPATPETAVTTPKVTPNVTPQVTPEISQAAVRSPATDPTDVGSLTQGELPPPPRPTIAMDPPLKQPVRTPARQVAKTTAGDGWPEPVPALARQSTETGVEEVVMERLRLDPRAPSAVFDYALIRLLNAKADNSPDAALAAGRADGHADGRADEGFGQSVTSAGVLRPSDQKILGTLAEGLVAFRDHLDASPNASPQSRIEPILEVAEKLEQQAGLRLPTVKLCSRVDSFGVYKPMVPTFPVGQVHQVCLYIEVEHFQTRSTPDGLFETHVTANATLYDPTGRPVGSLLDESSAIVPSHRLRRDMFVGQIVNLPDHVTPGEHVLKVTVKDEIGGRVAQQSIAIDFVRRSN